MANIEKRETPDGRVTFRVKVRLRGYPVQSATHAVVAGMNEKIFGVEEAA